MTRKNPWDSRPPLIVQTRCVEEVDGGNVATWYKLDIHNGIIVASSPAKFKDCDVIENPAFDDREHFRSYAATPFAFKRQQKVMKAALEDAL